MIDYQYLAGGVVADAELRFTPSGSAVCQFRIAQSDSKPNDQGGWDKQRSLYIPVSIWNETRGDNPTPWAEIASTLMKGDRVVVWGKMITNEWQDKEGNSRSRIEFQAYRLYLDASRTETPPQQGGGFGGQQAQQPPSPQQGHGWGSAAPTGQQTAMNDEPPF